MNNQPADARMLSGIRVLDFTQYLAGPTVTRFMVELGAEVIKVEQAPGGDPSRMLPFVRDGRSAYFVQQNRGKQSLCVDLSNAEAAELLRALAAKVDVVVENYGPGVLEKRGLAYADLSKQKPALIMASISAFGRTGPLAGKVGFDLMAQAFSGLSHMTGDPQGPPQFVHMGIADVSSGVHAFGAIAAALFHRQRTGRGQWIDVAMVDALYHCHELNVQAYANSGGAYVPLRGGSQHPATGPYGIYRGPQGWIALLVLDRQWPAMAEALGQPGLVSDPRFETGPLRGRNRAELTRIVESWMQTFPDDAAVLAALERHRVPAAPVLSVAETVGHPHFEARQMIRRVPDRILGEVTIPGFPLKFSEFPQLPELHAPLLGEHNAAVLRELLAFDETRIADLAARGVLHAAPS
ncbi:MAG: CoA transferase [Deltaproteobacteria bacterium]|nr:CoA transferase [Deltaproteobacteria bacterium]